YLNEWTSMPAVAEIKTDDRLRARFWLRWNDEGLYLAAHVADPSPLINRASDLRLLFKGGDCIDLQLGLGRSPENHPTEILPGDLRVLWAMINGKPTAVIYRYRVPGTPDAAKVVFASPVRRITADVVDIWDEPPAAFRQAGDGYDFEALVPWSRLGSEGAPQARAIPADLGVLFSTPTGDAVAERLYWSNPAAGAVSDVPSEAEIVPQLWGWARFAAH
ncbi:MAG: hypothetical protein N2512_14915, partial [Armatimonadetes bacterium]|nr:hypothetical protein [Armatimonadota bacterium]